MSAASAGPRPAPDRHELDATELGRAIYPLLTSTVVPRPIAWVSSMSAQGVVNVAPHSFFTVAGVAPPTLLFCSIGTKDSLRNIRATEQFVVNVVTRELAEACNLTSVPFPADVSELSSVGLHPEASRRVRPPRLAESPVAFECQLSRLVDVGGDCTVIFGEVLHVAVSTAVVTSDSAATSPDRPPQVSLAALAPVSRLGGNDWGEVDHVFTLRRLRYEEWTALADDAGDPPAAARAAARAPGGSSSGGATRSQGRG